MLARSTRTRIVALVAAAALLAAACGGDDDSAEDDVSAAAEDVASAEDELSDAESAVEDEVSEAASSAEEEMSEAASSAEEEMSEAASSAEVEMSEDTAAESGTADAPAASSGDTLVIWADENRVAPLQEIAPTFTEATGVEVQIELVPGEDMRDQVTQAAPAGEGPDLFVGAHDWTGELAANGIIDSIDVTAKQDEFVEQALQVFNFEGQNYAVPYATEAIAMYRNTDFAPDAPATWDDVIATCEEAAPPTCVALPGGGSVVDAYHQYPFISGFGGYVFAFDESSGFDSADVGLDTPGAVDGAAYLEQLATDGTIPSTDYDTAKSLFLGGEAAYWITGPWELAGLRDQTTVNFDVSPIPEFSAGPAQPFVGGQGFFLSSFSLNSLLAQSFLLDFVATDETMQALYEGDPRGAAWVAVQDGLADDPQALTFSEAVQSGVPMPNIPQMAAVWGPLGDNLLLIRNGEQSADESMTTAADAVRNAVSG